MSYNKIFVWRIFFLLLIFVFIYQLFYNSLNEPFNNFAIKSNETNNICSKLCCFSGWPNTINVIDKNITSTDINTKYNTTNYTCNDGYKTGCICEKI